MNEMFFTVLMYAAGVLGAWLVLGLLIGLVVGKGIHLADEREIGPQSDTEAERSAA